MDDLTSGNSTATVEATPATETSPSTNGTGTPSGEANGGQSATAQDTFIPQGIDLNTLPPQARAYIEKVNADMVRGFTEKTTKLSETIKSESAKAAEAYRQKAEQYDQLASNEEFTKRWNDYVAETQRLQETGQPTVNDPVLKEMKTKLDELSQELQFSKLSQITEAFVEAVDEKGNKLNPDFNELNHIDIGTRQNGNKQEAFSLLRACVDIASGATPQEKLANGYKAAKAVKDQIFELGRKSGLGQLRQKVSNSSIPPTGSNPEVLTTTEKKPKNAHEALEMARKGIMVSRD